MKENNNFSEEDSIDIIALLKPVWSGRKLIIKGIIIFFIIGCVAALTSPEVYESETTFVPQTYNKQSSSNKSLGSLASLAGINLNSETSSSLENYISPLLYSRIIESDEFSMKLINEELMLLNGDRFSVKDYMLKDTNSFNIIGFIKKYTIGLFTSSNAKEVVDSEILENYNFISSEDFGIITAFKRRFSIELNDKVGYIKVIATDKVSLVSTLLVKLVTKHLQSRIISLRTNKIKEQLDYSKLQYEKKKYEFETLQNNLAEFKDSNKNISTAVFLSELQR